MQTHFGLEGGEEQKGLGVDFWIWGNTGLGEMVYVGV